MFFTRDEIGIWNTYRFCCWHLMQCDQILRNFATPLTVLEVLFSIWQNLNPIQQFLMLLGKFYNNAIILYD